MKLISSRRTWFYKKIVPVMLVVVAVASLVPILAAQGTPGGPPLFVFLVPLIVIGMAGFMTLKLTGDLADEVQDCGDTLLVRLRGQEEQVALSNIMNVGYSIMISPPRITLRLRQPGRFGKEITFCPQRMSFLEGVHFRSAIADDLIERVDAARGK